MNELLGNHGCGEAAGHLRRFVRASRIGGESVQDKGSESWIYVVSFQQNIFQNGLAYSEKRSTDQEFLQ